MQQRIRSLTRNEKCVLVEERSFWSIQNAGHAAENHPPRVHSDILWVPACRLVSIRLAEEFQRRWNLISCKTDWRTHYFIHQSNHGALGSWP